MKKNKGKIILIDDDEVFCEELTKIIRSEGYQISAFSDSLRGLDSLSNNVYDLLLLDLKTPHLSGSDVLSIIRQKGIKIKIIVITGNPDKEKIGIPDLVLVKPFDPKHLIAKIKELTETED
ncbi:hypothetical protein A2276_01965 [candidate division WOR-1 bacterium RIFOXYA12_FULL_43_27]|uniref:Response regulatory domain-containing protein n=1 Tax=candidate division WOR-1 bacterium RIFOXYC2_FULL_46_14 TaxID=1802587 RepID=A0A1F4U6H6_UNCSA|nr:MAG: hypothetical protein A2276_01965 [candidate division WOR-1 bacterium RIFOXYA12_FULL_43_27]OGC19512.1 MAG: hypothetical protein A2292_02365 [candidate division WOR-1 bacterium RIFOXYB2_FULL_46_45]OGC30500.1 MAG: hypothetical protein A2232_02365 [candidate division WOR-1 bacterium RIFOXYA2_FULL_46_56]OGC40568.1 MAG: hypothetical protein A2438_06080 [candidate division WOR-1 bacterium RIFOXYC2_FULL_46_14]